MTTIRENIRTSVSRTAGLIAVIGLAFAVGVVTPSSAAAQSQILTGPKQAAMRAAAAANAQTAAMQNTDAVSPAVPSSKSAPAPQPSRRPSAPIVASTPAPAAAAKPVAAARPAPGAGGKGTVATAGAAPVASSAKTSAPAAGAKASVPGLAKATPAAPGAASPTAATAGGDSAGSISVTERGVKGEVSLNREVFSYDASARRDPFISLMRSGDLRPMLSDLRLTTVLYDATGQNSIAVMRDQSTKDQYRVRVGMTLGRMRVAQIQPKQVVFTIEEVGFSRQEALALGDTTKARTP
jgi:hypothetical protein